MPELIDNSEKKCPRCAEMVKADALVCRFCGYEFAPSEPAAPVVVRKRGRQAALGCLVVVAATLAVATCTSKLTQPGSILASSPLGVDTQLQDIQSKVAEDAVKQYNMAVSGGGSAMDVCVQAGLVTAAFLQAQDQHQYEKWKETEKADCKRAGLRK